MRVFVVDMSAAVRLRLAALVASAGGEVSGEAVDLEVAAELLPVLAPDVLVIGARLAGARLRELVVSAKLMEPAPAVIVLTSLEAPSLRHQCLAAGADYIIDKADAAHALVGILRMLSREPPASA